MEFVYWKMLRQDECWKNVDLKLSLPEKVLTMMEYMKYAKVFGSYKFIS